MKFIRLRWTVYRVLTWLASRLDDKAFSVLVELDKKDRHFADRKWANELNARLIQMGEKPTRPWAQPMKPYAKKRWPDLYEQPTKR